MIQALPTNPSLRDAPGPATLGDKVRRPWAGEHGIRVLVLRGLRTTSVRQASQPSYSSSFLVKISINCDSDRMWSTGEGNGKPLQYSCLENPMKSMKRQKVRTVKYELPRLVGAQYATRDQWRNNSRKNEGMEPQQKQHPVGDGTGERSKVQCCKEQYCRGTWNVMSMNQVNQK